MKTRSLTLVLFALTLLFGGAPAGLAQTPPDADIIVEKSRILFEEMMISPDKQVPVDLLKQAAGIALIPGMLKGGVIIGGNYGKGVVLQRSAEGWTGPAFIGIGGGSLGLQIGGQSVDLILVIVGEDAMNAFMRNEFKLGADAALAVGPAGVRVSSATDVSLRGGIYSYSRASGLFAGVSVEGAVVFSDEELNLAYYKDTGSTAVILAGKLPAPASARALIAALEKFR
jgi:lipid-binding SYLF domain-containing protein